MSDAMPDRQTWRRLLRVALEVIESVERSGYGPLDFRLGGGTVLMLRMDHRISKDIDIFTNDAQALGFITPRLNPAVEHLSLGYEEQPNAVKLLLADGDIDFIVAAPVIVGAPPETITEYGRTIPLESTAEILAKKLLYRPCDFQARDVFDMAAALALDPPAALVALRAAAPTRPALRRRLTALRTFPAESLTARLLPTERGSAFVSGMIDVVERAIDEIDAEADRA